MNRKNLAPLKGATFRRVPPPEPKERVKKTPEEMTEVRAARRALKPRKMHVKAAYLTPPLLPIKRREREAWRKNVQRALDNGNALDRPEISNLDLMRLLKTLDHRDEDIRDLTGQLTAAEPV
jgi:hypothetical protein